MHNHGNLQQFMLAFINVKLNGIYIYIHTCVCVCVYPYVHAHIICPGILGKSRDRK